jgi:glycerol-3-phosphate dehydrogenase
VFTFFLLLLLLKKLFAFSPPQGVCCYMLCFQLNHNLVFSFSGMVAALTNESATSKSVYFAHCTSEMIFITHLLTEQPEKLAGPLLADTYVTLLKGRNAWYGQMLAKGELRLDMGDSIKGKGMIQVIL